MLVGINESQVDLTDFPDLPIFFQNIQTSSTLLPIAEARNAGARFAQYEKLIFLDVDCIPGKDFFRSVLKDQVVSSGCVMGTPYYLDRECDVVEDELLNYSIPHPHRPFDKEVIQILDYNLFWSLCFLIDKKTFFEIDGFDESYKGYGAEDTDFGWKLAENNISFYQSPARVFHQQHPVYSPPYHYFQAIVRNAEIFHKKWGKWVMEDWLEAFSKKGLINWSSDMEGITVIREPKFEEVQEVIKPNARFM